MKFSGNSSGRYAVSCLVGQKWNYCTSGLYDMREKQAITNNSIVNSKDDPAPDWVQEKDES
jgi:hypothetical protein